MSNFQAGSSMLSIGLNWWQAFITLFCGHVIVALLTMVIGFPGLYHHISFPVATRIAWGFHGSIFVVLNRIILSIVWCGVQSWQGGLMTYVCLRAMWPGIDNLHNTIPEKTGMNLQQFIGFVVYFVIQLPFVFLNPSRLRYLTYIGSVSGCIVQVILAGWACATMGSGGFGDVMADEASPLVSSQVPWVGVYSISVTISSMIAGALSTCDYTRFAKRPASALCPQAVGFAPAWVSNVLGILTVAATQQRYGDRLWSVAQLLTAMQSTNPATETRVAVFFAAFGFFLSQVSLNVMGNTFSGGTDIASLLPKYINIRRGQLLTVFLGLVINPWYLLSGATIFVSVMSAYAVFLQPFIGILLAHYFVVQKRRIKVSDLYTLDPQGIYWYTCGVNWRSVLAWVAAVAPHMPGFLMTVNPSIKVSTGVLQLYYLSSMTGFLIGQNSLPLQAKVISN
ncbi:allantoin permease, partial [Metarhizium majus ARSEF 297]